MTPFFSLVSAIARLIRYYVATSTSPEWSGLASVPTFPARGERDSDPGTMLADKGYDSDAIRQDLRDSGATPKIPTRSNRKVQVRDQQIALCAAVTH